MPNFWNNSTLEPKRKHRWLVYLNNANIPSYIATKVDKPSFKINEMEHKYFGHSFFYPGHVSWETISLTLIDPIDEDASFALMSLLRRAGYASPEGSADNTLPTVAKADFVAALGNSIRIEQVSGADNRLVETWVLHNPWITDCKFGDLDHGSDDLVEITLTLRYDWATMVDARGRTEPVAP